MDKRAKEHYSIHTKKQKSLQLKAKDKSKRLTQLTQQATTNSPYNDQVRALQQLAAALYSNIQIAAKVQPHGAPMKFNMIRQEPLARHKATRTCKCLSTLLPKCPRPSLNQTLSTYQIKKSKTAGCMRKCAPEPCSIKVVSGC